MDVGRKLERRHRGDTTYNSHGSLAFFRLWAVLGGLVSAIFSIIEALELAGG